MSHETRLERAEQSLERDLESGLIDSAEYSRQVRDIRREFREMAEEEARRAYDNALDRHGY